MFVDKTSVTVQAGDGGNGAVSFRHEKFIDKGGPDGGDGGNGGDIILEASRNQDTLSAFRYQRLLKAELGQSGSKRRKHGKSGKDLLVQVPIGTTVTREKELVADLTKDGEQVVIAKGGKGGFGNANFVSSTRQAPRVAEKGEKGEKLELELELRMIADVGLVGLPNAGKSTLLASISHAHPEIADYPFTTLSPNLGVVDIDKKTSILIADIPGLIEGASEGKGLGDEFLRHIERTSVLVHLIDIYQDVASAYKTIQKELQAYRIDLTRRPQVVVLNKIEGVDEEIVEDATQQLKKVVPKSTSIFAISAKSKINVAELLFHLQECIQKTNKTKTAKSKKELPILRLPETQNAWKVVKEDDRFVITGRKIERFAERTDFSNPQSVERLRDIMKKMGIMHELIRREIRPGDSIIIGSPAKGKLKF